MLKTTNVLSNPFVKRMLMRASAARTPIVYAVDALTLAASAALAFLLRLDFHLPRPYPAVLVFAIIFWVPAKLAAFRILGLDRRWARYLTFSDLLTLTLSNLLGSVVAGGLLLAFNIGVPRSVYAIDFILCCAFTASTRIAVRILVEKTQGAAAGPPGKRTLIYGAGRGGAALLRELRQNPALNYHVCAFVDDNPRKTGFILDGITVGLACNLPALVRKHNIEIVLIAIPSATGRQMKDILERCNEAGVPYKTVPGLGELIYGGKDLARQIRDVAVEDLLGRSPVNLEQERISARLRGRVVLITGAAGSIGSEICRQVARFEPAAIIGFEIAESPLFYLGLELARDFPSCTFHQEIGSIQNRTRLREVFDRHRPSVVYHAAAYKHVPMMEANIFEAIENNVFGTLNVVETCRESGVREFVMISSDKAVRPASIMGATKRLAEIVVRSLQPENSRYVSVRFGNVLGSNGSVVPIFKEQIARGGPVTVTDPGMRRYFMTIPEACQLVLQASTMGNGGEIFVLDMGEPVRIVDLALNLIMLSGLRPGHDIEIKFTGRRPGEKLFEELNEDAENLTKTHHQKIYVFEGGTRPSAELQVCLQRLGACSRSRDICGLLDALTDAVPEYTCQHAAFRAYAAEALAAASPV